MKICSRCKEDKDLSEFTKSKNGKYGIHHYCKICKRSFANKNYSYDKSKQKNLNQNYKLTNEKLQELYIKQKGCCKICGSYNPLLSKRGGLFIDHDHATGKVRGLLCIKCNCLLGHCNDDINILKKSIKYLQNS